jgi:hypothetical protein
MATLTALLTPEAEQRARIAALLSAAIDADGRDQQVIAAEAGMSPGQLSRLKNGTRGLRGDVAADLDAALRAPTDLVGAVREARAILRAAKRNSPGLLSLRLLAPRQGPCGHTASPLVLANAA